MKTFEEAKNRIKTFEEKVNEKSGEEKGLIKDFEDLGVKEQTFSREEIQSAWDSTIDEPTLSDPDEGFFSVDESPSFRINTVEGESDCDVEVIFQGTVEVESVNEGKIVDEIMRNLDSFDDDYDQNRWTWDEVEEALSDIYWESYILVEADEIEAEIIDVSYDGSNANIEYGIKEGSYFIQVDMDGLNGELEENLNSSK